ncbi:MAG: sulfurtransferase [Pseudomonadota bacterium]
MRFPGLICSTDELAAAEQPVIIDCSFDLADTEWGRRCFRDHHILCASYAHLDEDLSGEIVSGKTGRHPLPDRSKLVQRLQQWGVNNSSLVIVYDQGPGAHAARLWWLLRDLGHSNVAVLDGGFARWTAESRPTTSLKVEPTPGQFQPHESLTRLVSADDILADIQARDVHDPRRRLHLIDARDPARFEGRTEPIDPIAGHIPGADCYFFGDNLGEDGGLDLDAIANRFTSLSDENLVCYCGSGVTAIHNILAIRLAGLDEPALYPGSWSEWITDATRPIATS